MVFSCFSFFSWLWLVEMKMAKIDFKSVDEYIASQPAPAQGVLNHVRRIIRAAVPRAEEVISYNLPTYKLHGEPVLYVDDRFTP